MFRIGLALALVGGLWVGNASKAQQPLRDRVGRWEIGLIAGSQPPYCYASIDFETGRRLIMSVDRSVGLLLMLWNEAGFLRPNEDPDINIWFAFDDEAASDLAAHIVAPQMVVIPVIEQTLLGRLTNASRLTLTVEGQKFEIDLTDSGAAYAEAYRCVGGSDAGSKQPTLWSATEQVDGWSLTADSQGGQFTSCTAVPARSKWIGFKINRQFHHLIVAIDDRWNLPVRQRVPVIALIDGTSIATSAWAHAPNALLIYPGDGRHWLDLLRSGQHLIVRVGDNGNELELSDAIAALAALERCVRREVATGGPKISGGGYTLQQVQAHAIALLRDAGIEGFDLYPEVEPFERANNLGWVYTGGRGAGMLQVLRQSPDDFLERRTAELIGLFRNGCLGTYDARIRETAEGPGWRARRVYAHCDRHATPGMAGIKRWIVLRFDNGIGMTVGSVQVGTPRLPGAPPEQGDEIDEAIWRSSLLRRPPTE